MDLAHRNELPGRIIGMLVFILGIGLLLLVFKIAYTLFTASPDAALGFHITGDAKVDPGAAKMGQYFGWMILKIMLLFVMSVAASCIGQRGINLYFSSVHGSKHDGTIKPAATVSAEG
jgi:hypothetical protein